MCRGGCVDLAVLVQLPTQLLVSHTVCCVQAPVRNWAWHPDAYFRTPAITAGQCEEQQLWDLPQSFFTNGWRDLRCTCFRC